ncbi:MAG: ABC transporter permease [Armatimonadota bacterium]|nr:ABC transporter permease [Armatimonadota bacterium]MDR7422759.1 ABC transporter permease [Armatimonadota bacterium]MDR7456600.1 ABC transporter permease [Armatimonadota bacterium]MDR7497709.1 ABC transporter permease [Armatimonadota bacterium]MDR7510690.1 ABC transporter permease [Armatimonadota bacterium]
MGAVTVAVLLVAWETAGRVGLLSAYHFPRPSRLAVTIWDLVVVGFPVGVTVWQHVGATIARIVQGYVLAAALAVPLGLVIGGVRALDQATAPVVTFARSVATISLLPLAVAWFGVGERSRVLLIAYGCFWVILTNVVEGVKSVDPELIRAGRMLGSTPRQVFTRVVLPASTPRIFAGMKVALGLAFMVIVGVEMIGTIKGLGALIMEARTFYRSDTAMVGMIFIALFGFALARLLDRLERVLLPWSTGLEAVER